MGKEIKDGRRNNGKHPNQRRNLKPIKPGEVRNPEGKNGSTHPFTERIKKLSEQLLSATPDGEKLRRKEKMPKHATWGDLAVQRLMQEAVNGNVRAMTEMADRVEGKSVTRIASEDGGPIEISATVKFVNAKN